MSHLLWLIPALPLAGFLANGLLRLPRGVAGIVGCAGPVAGFLLSLGAIFEVHHHGRIGGAVFDWISVGGAGAEGSLHVPFGLAVDPLSAVMLLVVTGVGSLIHVYSIDYMREDEGFSRFFAYLNLFMFSMLLLVLGDSILLMFVGWEGVGLCSYLLVGFWYKELKNADAGKKAFITNRIGDFGFLLGMFCLWQMFGTLDFEGMRHAHAVDDRWGYAAAALLFLGACGKSAQIPLYVWLPDAMAGPTPVSALIHAATMVTAGVYMMARMSFLYAASEVMGLVVLVGAATALLAGVIAVAQNDIKKVLAYSTISQLGFMFAGIATAEFATGLFHVVTHAFFKALLFLGAGAVIHALHGEQDIRKMGGLGRKLPGLTAVFAAGGLALAGMPGSAGFFSKDAILVAVYEKSNLPSFGVAWLILLVTAGLTAFYTTRLVLVVFLDRPGPESAHGHETAHGHGPDGGTPGAGGHLELHKPGLLMMGPLWVLAVLSVFGGVVFEKLLPLEEFLKPVWPAARGEVSALDHAHAGRVNFGMSGAVFALGVALGWFLYGRASGRDWVKRFAQGGGRALYSLVEHKFYVDEIYEYAVIAPVKMGATLLWFLVDRVLIDTLLVNGTGWAVYGVGRALRRTQTGTINVGVASFLAGALAVLAFLVYLHQDTRLRF